VQLPAKQVNGINILTGVRLIFLSTTSSILTTKLRTPQTKAHNSFPKTSPPKTTSSLSPTYTFLSSPTPTSPPSSRTTPPPPPRAQRPHRLEREHLRHRPATARNGNSFLCFLFASPTPPITFSNPKAEPLRRIYLRLPFLLARRSILLQRPQSLQVPVLRHRRLARARHRRVHRCIPRPVSRA